MSNRTKRIVADYSKLNPGGGGSYLKVFIRLRPSEPSTGGEFLYSLTDSNKIAIKENKEPFPTEHVFNFHRIFDKDTTQDVSISGKHRKLHIYFIIRNKTA